MIPQRRSAQLALQASLLLAMEPDGRWRRIKDIAAALGVPATYLAKVSQSLTQAGLLRSVRGPGGGLRPAREICLWDVLVAVGPVHEYERCILGLEQCSDSAPCPLHEMWAPVRQNLLHRFQTISLAEFARAARAKGIRPAKVGGAREEEKVAARANSRDLPPAAASELVELSGKQAPAPR